MDVSLFEQTRNPHVLVVYNPAAGLKRGGCPLYDVIDQLEVWGCRVEFMETCGWSTVSELHRQAVHYDLVISIGGDGTLHLVANALAGTNVPLGILPCGTANDLAGSLGIPIDWRVALEMIRRAKLQTIDLGRVNGRFFLNVASLGISAKVARAVQPASKRRWGKWAYVMETIRQLSSRDRIPLVLTIDGVAESMNVMQVSVANGVQFGGGWRVAHDASLSDGIFHVVVVEQPFPSRKRESSRGTAPGAGEERPVLMERIADKVLHTNRLRIDARHTLELNLDGEAVRMVPPLEFGIHRSSLRIAVPPLGLADKTRVRTDGVPSSRTTSTTAPGAEARR